MAEWGNPAGVSQSRFFGSERTEGTETSQYLEEEKSTEMPRVAASEIGEAQTDLLVGSGL